MTAHHPLRALEAYRHTGDRALLGVNAFMFAVALAVAAFKAEWRALLLAGVPALVVPFLINFLTGGGLVLRLAIATSLMAFSALTVHQLGGMIEAHFAFFVVLAMLLIWCDWRPLFTAAAVAAVHHLGFNFLQAAGYPIYVFVQGADFRLVVVHAVYVVVETAFLIYMALLLERLILTSSRAADIALSIAQGDLTQQFAAQDVARSEMLQALSGMQEALRRLIGSARENAQVQLRLAQSLEGSVCEIASGSAAQSDAASSTAASVEEMSVSVSHLAENAQDARKHVADSAQLAAEGRQLVRQTVDDIQVISSSIRGASDSVRALGEASEKAAGIVRIIKEIADQTNLLALNAAIEAARAGEAGRGFAVVSDEVRKLAERTTNATSEISGMISAMQGRQANVLERISEAVGRVDSGIALAQRADAAIERLAAGAQEVAALMAGVADALDEQRAASHDIAQHTERVTHMSDQARQQTQRIGEEIATLRRLSEELSATVAQFRTA
jgi:methyl-accepting chemotaxis protein